MQPGSSFEFIHNLETVQNKPISVMPANNPGQHTKTAASSHSSLSAGSDTTALDVNAAKTHQGHSSSSGTMLSWALLAGSLIAPELFLPFNRTRILFNPLVRTSIQLALRHIPRFQAVGLVCLFLSLGIAWIYNDREQCRGSKK